MANAINSDIMQKAIKSMMKAPTSLERMKIEKEDIDTLKEYGFSILYSDKLDSYYIVKNDETKFFPISFKSNKKATEKWLEISELQIGHRFFDEAALRYVLKQAEQRGYYDVYIAGDIFAGHIKYTRYGDDNFHNLNPDFINSHLQIEYAVSILKDYPKLRYYAVMGLRDMSFEKNGEINPFRILKKRLEAVGVEFIFVDDFAWNFLINGCVKRLAYDKGSSKKPYTKAYIIDQYYRRQIANNGSSLIVNGKSFKIQAIQIGNAGMESYDLKEQSIYFTSTPGFVLDASNLLSVPTTVPSGMLCDVTFYRGNIISFRSECIRKPVNVQKV